VGDPALNPAMGPVVNEKSMKTILGYVENGVAEGGRLITGGSRAQDAGEGYFIQPTVDCRRRSDGYHFAARDLRTGAGGDQVAQL